MKVPVPFGPAAWRPERPGDQDEGADPLATAHVLSSIACFYVAISMLCVQWLLLRIYHQL